MDLLWQLSYHLSGVTLLGSTEQEMLGRLPVPLRTSLLLTAANLDPDLLDLEVSQEPLLFNDGSSTRVRRWSFKDKKFAEILRDPKTSNRRRFTSAQHYFEYYHLLDDEGEHFAECLFVKKVFVPLFGTSALSFLNPQVPLEDSKGKSRRIDFVLEGAKRYAVEIEGASYHDKEQWT